MKTTILLALMCLLVPPRAQTHNGESEGAARSRYSVIAEAVATEAGNDQRLALFLLTVARHESSFKRKVHAGKERGDDLRAWGTFQMIAGRGGMSRIPGTPYLAHEIVGVSQAATRRAVNAAATHLRKHIKACSGKPWCTFVRYGGVSDYALTKPHVRKILKARVATFGRLRRASAVRRP